MCVGASCFKWWSNADPNADPNPTHNGLRGPHCDRDAPGEVTVTVRVRVRVRVIFTVVVKVSVSVRVGSQLWV